MLSYSILWLSHIEFDLLSIKLDITTVNWMIYFLWRTLKRLIKSLFGFQEYNGLELQLENFNSIRRKFKIMDVQNMLCIFSINLKRLKEIPRVTFEH